MKRRWLPLLANLFVVAYALDGGVSLIELSLRAATGSTLLLGVRNALALPVFYAAIVCIPLLTIAARLPTLLFLTLSLSALWLNLGAAPLALYFESQIALDFTAVFIQVAVAAGALLWIRRRNSGRIWLFTHETFNGPLVSLKHSFVYAAGLVFLLTPTIIAYLLVHIATSIQLSTQSFVSFDLAGVSLADRHYERSGREVRLVGMMHIGDEDAYRTLVSTFVSESTVVLQEGVTDDLALIEVPLSYERAAVALGLEEQEDLRLYLDELSGEELSEWPVLRHADLDMSDFAPETLEWLEAAARVWIDDQPLTAFREFVERIAEREDEWIAVYGDIIELRNEHLLGELEAALPDYDRIIIPWGALHLPYVERSILEMGFEPTFATHHRLISWLAVLGALLDDPETAPND